MAFPTRIIPYEEGLIDITADGEDVWLQFTGKSYEGFICENLYSRYLEPLICPDDIYRDRFMLNGSYSTEDFNGNAETVQMPLDDVT